MTQHKAFRLADALESGWCPVESPRQMEEAAAELRRLHGLDFALRDCELALNKMATKYMDASDQRDALLAALKTVEWHGGGSCWVVDADKIAAALATAEENT